MCGRFTLTIEVDDIQTELNLQVMESDWKPSYNIAPTQNVVAISNTAPKKLTLLKWGLIPFWAKDPTIGVKMINARAETLTEKPSFRQAYEKRRCVILADGFYEWDRSGNLPGTKSKSTPVYFHLQPRRLFGFAGLWESWNNPKGGMIQSCTIITCPPNEMVGKIHNRMPVILTGEKIFGWLEKSPGLDLAGYLIPYPAEEMTMYPVSRLVNSPDVNQASLILPMVS